MLMLFAIILLFIGSLFCLFVKPLSRWLALAETLAAILLAAIIFVDKTSSFAALFLKSYPLSAGCFLAASIFTLLTIVFSFKFMDQHDRAHEYYAYLLMSLFCAAGVLFSSDFLFFSVFWALSGLFLYLLIGIGQQAQTAAQKAFLIVGGSDILLLIGIAILWSATGSLEIGHIRIWLHHPAAILSFTCLLVPALAKLGAVPFHVWVTDSAKSAPAPVMAYLPAAMDKLLGIYFVYRLCFNVFLLEPNSLLSNLIMLLGSLTLVTAVFSALFQHDLKKLLSFHAVSQVGYMLLGIGSAVPLAVAGSLFHMLNNTIYKSLLFFASGNIEKQAKTTQLDGLGGLSKPMPITFICVLVASLSISGIPPFNGFVSKWMIYQGLIELKNLSPWWMLWVLVAMFGSSLTLASFIKVLYSVFLGHGHNRAQVTEAPPAMTSPLIFLACLCLLFGIGAFALPLKYFILPSVSKTVFIGFFMPSLAAGLLLLGLIIGLAIYLLGTLSGKRTVSAYIGGELLDENMVKVPGTSFYHHIRHTRRIGLFVRLAEAGWFNLYTFFEKVIYTFARGLKFFHSGNLAAYMLWLLSGFMAIAYILFR